MVIGLFGGTFNPPHFGHQSIAQQVIDFTDVEQIWFLPGYRHTFLKPALSFEHRLTMTKLFVDSMSVTQKNIFRLSTLEIDHQLDGNTIHLLPYLPAEHSYKFIIGSDQLPTFHLWGQWESLLKQLSFLVFPRYGYPNEPLYPGMTMVNDPSLIVSNISSTKIRDRVSRGLSIEQFVPKTVVEYIEKNNLFMNEDV